MNVRTPAELMIRSPACGPLIDGFWFVIHRSRSSSSISSSLGPISRYVWREGAPPIAGREAPDRATGRKRAEKIDHRPLRVVAHRLLDRAKERGKLDGGVAIAPSTAWSTWWRSAMACTSDG